MDLGRSRRPDWVESDYMHTLELSVIVLGFVGGWFSRKGWKLAETEMALRRHRQTLKNFNWRR